MDKEEKFFLTPSSLITELETDAKEIVFSNTIYDLYNNIFGSIFSLYQWQNPDSRISRGGGAGTLLVYEKTEDLTGKVIHEIKIDELIEKCRPELRYSETDEGFFIVNSSLIQNEIVPYFWILFEDADSLLSEESMKSMSDAKRIETI